MISGFELGQKNRPDCAKTHAATKHNVCLVPDLSWQRKVEELNSTPSNHQGYILFWFCFFPPPSSASVLSHQQVLLPPWSVSPHLLTILSTCHFGWYFGIYLLPLLKMGFGQRQAACSTMAGQLSECSVVAEFEVVQSREHLIHYYVTQSTVMICGWQHHEVSHSWHNTHHKTART